jgi:hypothetical protein
MSNFQLQPIGGIPRARVSGNPNALAERLGETPVSEWLPRLYAMGWSGLIYSAANQAAQAISVALATTYTGIGIYNPPGSGVNLVPLKAKFALSAAPAGIATLGLLGGWAASGLVTAQTTKLNVQNGIIGNTGTGQGIALSAATITAPTWIEQLEDGFTAAALPAPMAPFYMDGHLSVAPGGFLGFGALTAVTGLGSIFWAELPV